MHAVQNSGRNAKHNEICKLFRLPFQQELKTSKLSTIIVKQTTELRI